MSIDVLHGDCLEVMRELPDNSIHAVVTDPPYGLSFMGKHWDKGVPGVPFWAEMLRILKPGGHLLSFAGSRTYHRLAVAIEDAGFEVRDQIMWVYGSGFPKSLDISKALDKMRDDRADVLAITSFMANHAERNGVSRADVDAYMGTSDMGGWWLSRLVHRCQVPKVEQYARLKELLSLPDDMDAEVWRLNDRKGKPGEAWGDRPNAEYAGRPGMAESWTDGRGWTGTLAKGGSAILDAAKQWQGWGTALKPAHEPLCLARKPLSEKTIAANVLKHGTGGLNVDGCRIGTTDHLNGGSYGNSSREVDDFFPGKKPGGAGMFHQPSGRYPANLIHDGSQEVLELFPETKGRATTHGSDRYQGKQYAGTGYYGTRGPHNSFTDTGSAARYFYCAKASRAERQGSKHPTIKPLALMRYLVRLITPPGGTVLDPFAGSGTTGQAALLEGFNAILIEREAEYMADIKRRLGMEAIA